MVTSVCRVLTLVMLMAIAVPPGVEARPCYPGISNLCTASIAKPYVLPQWKSRSVVKPRSGGYYKSGYPKVKRSTTAKKEFLKSRGYSRAPKGYEVDHIIPLSKGGRDAPNNMQLLSKEAHKRKTAAERRRK